MLRIGAKWEFAPEAPGQCAACGATLIAYLPTCRACGQPVEALMSQELPYTADVLEKAEGAIRVAHLSDLHIGQAWAPAFKPQVVFRLWLERLKQAEVDVVVVSGDVIERPGDKLGLQLGRGLLDDSGLPWVVVPGNHDVYRPGHPDAFNEVFGEYPRVEVLAGIEFILFDSMAGLPLEERDVAERLYGDYVCYTEGRVGAAQYAQVEAMLAPQGTYPRAVVLHHHVMRQHADLMPGVPKGMGVTEDAVGTMKTLIDADALVSWALRQRVRVVYHGHKHVFQQPGMRAGRLLVLNGGSSTLAPGNQRARFVDHLPDGRMQVMNITLMV
jgi:3',5'-cyclic AMP phosphodiesterase CpdA